MCAVGRVKPGHDGRGLLLERRAWRGDGDVADLGAKRLR
jgi:hypothetical protein